MNETLSTTIVLLVSVAVATVVAPKLRVSTPILLAVLGVGIAATPWLPPVELDPQLILAGFLPPLLYADAFETSWFDFKRWLRPIMMLAVGLVAFTILTVGFVAKTMLPELPWAACFTLGAIVSPTDTVAIQQLLERLRVPRRITAILGGESLINDATGLVGVQLGVAVAATGVFELGAIATEFALVAGGGMLIGAAIGVLFTAVNRWVRDTFALFALSLVSPYLAFLIAQRVQASGVLAVVIAGFIVSLRFHDVPAQARVQLFGAWRILSFLLNGFCFVFIGLEAPRILRATEVFEEGELLIPALAISAAVIVARIAWCFPSSYGPLLLVRALREREGGLPPWRGVAVVSWAGVRGAISLAAALALPIGFPGREALLACTLVVILVTLLVQGLTLPPLVKALGIRDDGASAREVERARESVLEAGIIQLDAFCNERECPVAVHRYRESMAEELRGLRVRSDQLALDAKRRADVSREVLAAVHQAQTGELVRMRDRGDIDDKTYFDLILEIDRTNVA